MKSNKRYALDQCALYKCLSRRRLEKILLSEPGSIKRIDEYIKYHTFEHPKKDGTNRNIQAPEKSLKAIQKRILNLLAPIEKPDWVISATRGRSYIDNARYHIESDYTLTMDIRSFYDNCTRDSVYRFFKYKMCTSSDVAEILTKICIYDGCIPTGSPTSQIVAYFAYEDMFHEIKSVAEDFNCKFTLYVDDMTFSSLASFIPKRLESTVDTILRKYGHKAKRRKTQYYSKDRNKLITGVAISKQHSLLVSNSLQKRVYDGFQQFNNNPSEELRMKLNSQIQVTRSVEHRKFPEIKRIINS